MLSPLAADFPRTARMGYSCIVLVPVFAVLAPWRAAQHKTRDGARHPCDPLPIYAPIGPAATGPGCGLVLAMVLGIAVAVSIWQTPQRINHDCANYLHIAEMVLDGAVPYCTVVNINPPLSTYLHIPHRVACQNPWHFADHRVSSLRDFAAVHYGRGDVLLVAEAREQNAAGRARGRVVRLDGPVSLDRLARRRRTARAPVRAHVRSLLVPANPSIPQGIGCRLVRGAAGSFKPAWECR